MSRYSDLHLIFSKEISIEAYSIRNFPIQIFATFEPNVQNIF